MLRLVPPRPRPADPVRLPERTVLVVDDLPQILELWRGLARRVPGLRVRLVTEGSGPRALDLVARTPFDVVVSDHRLGEVDGLRVLQQACRAHPHGRRVLMTGYQEVPAPLDRVRAAHVDAYLAKPFAGADAVRLLESLLVGHPLGLAVGRARARALEEDAEKEGACLQVPARPPTFLQGPRV